MSEATKFPGHAEVGAINGVYGVRGWVKVYSHTDPKENILRYKPWKLMVNGKLKEYAVIQGKRQGKGLIAQLRGVDTREDAAALQGAAIWIDESALPSLAEGEFYWRELEGLTVLTLAGVRLGKVSHLMETGANDVLVVEGDGESLDQQQRLLPYLPDHVIKEINLEAGEMVVDWDPDF